MQRHGRRRRSTGPLQELACFSSWPTDRLDAVARNSTLVDVPAGHVVARAGQRSQPLVIVVTGDLVVKADGSDDRLVRPGEFWGAELLLGVGPAPETLLTLTSARLAVMQPGEFWHLFDTCPSFAMAVARDLASRLAAS